MPANSTQSKTRFQISEFVNRSGSNSWRVSGIGRDGKRVRQNFLSLEAARAKHLELEADYLGRQGPEVLKPTNLTDNQLRLAEAVFLRLDRDEDILPATDQWLSNGRETQVNTGKRLDSAVDDFCAWVDNGSGFRDKTRINLKSRAKIFRSVMGDLDLSSITPETIDEFVAKRKVSPVTLDNDRRALSRFFRFCCERRQRWMLHNPCREVRVPQPERPAPEILTLKQCKRLLNEARKHKEGKLLGYVVLGLFGGLRPFEAARLTHDKINFSDREIRIEAEISKVKRSRVIALNPSLRTWLSVCRKKPFAPGDWDNELRAVRKAAKIERWPADVLRHTALSHYFRLTKSFGATAEWGGTSEAIIREHYMSRVSTADCKRYWRMRP